MIELIRSAWEQGKFLQAIAMTAVAVGIGYVLVGKIGGGAVRRSLSNIGKKKGLDIEGKHKEKFVELAIRAKRQKVYRAAPDIKQEESRKYPKTAAEAAIIKEALKNNFVFSNMSDADVEQIVLYLEPLSVPEHKDVVVQGDNADYFYVIKEGVFSVLVGTSKVGELTGGKSFGETGLLYDSVRNATVRADEDAAVWRLDRDTFRQQLAKMHVTQSVSLSHSLKSARILKDLSDECIDKLDAAAVQVDYKKGQVIMKKGDTGNLGYFILDGEVLVTDLPDGIPDITFGPGEHFGLHQLFSKETRFATFIADSDCMLSAISAEDVVDMKEDLEELARRDHELRKLKSIPLFSEFSAEMLSSLLSAMETKSFTCGETIIRQGDVGTTFYLIQSGACDVVQVDDDGGRTVVKTLIDLGYFGEMALLTDSPRNADVVASSDCVLLEVKQATFQRIFGSSSNFSRQLQEVVKGRDKALRLIKHPPEKIKREDLKVITLLGSGTFGTVHLVENVKNGLRYAVKEMSIEFIERHKQEANIVGEKEAMFLCDHPFILKLYSSFRDRYNIVLLLEFCSGGEMFNVIHNKDHNFIPESQAKFYAACEILALEHLALQSMAYRDMKPENTLVDQDGYCKLIDLGFAKVIKGRTYTFCGTPEYMAPEIILGSGHNRGVDYFALGVFIYEMIVGQTPFFDYDTDGIMRKIVRGKYRFGAGKWDDKPQAKSLIEKLLTADPSKRLGMLKGGVADIIDDPWFSDINFDDLIQKKIEAPWKPPEVKINAGEVEAESPPIDQGYESNAAWLENF